MNSKAQVKEFYEQVGWSRVRPGVFVDAAHAEDLRPVSQEYRTRCHLRVKRFLPPSGKFLLDVASGPVQYPEYLTYSQNYRYRLCADIARSALTEARAVLGGKGLYVQCDIARLPFASGALDGVVSLHTIYHVPAEEQAEAFAEIHRALKEGGRAAVVYSSNGRDPLNALALFPYRLAASLRTGLQRLLRRGVRAAPRLYFHAHPYRWLVSTLSERMDFEILVWRSVSVPFLRFYVHGRAGRAFLAWLYALEERFPRFLGRFGAYPLIVIRK